MSTVIEQAILDLRAGNIDLVAFRVILTAAFN